MSDLMYNNRVWLNKEDCRSTGSVVAFDGLVDWGSGPERSTFLEVADCHEKVKLHVASYDTLDDFIDKMKLLRETLSSFVSHLEANPDWEEVICC